MNIYITMFLVAFSTMTLEVTLARFLSVVTWYHLAFLAISTAMLGMTAGALTVFLRPTWFDKEHCMKSIAIACLGNTLTIPITLGLLCVLPLSISLSVANILAYLLVIFICSLPYFFSGVAVSALLTKVGFPVGKIYAVDLIGASLGCLFVLGMLELVDAPSLILICAILSSLAASILAVGISENKIVKIALAITTGIIIAVIVNITSPYKLHPLFTKGRRIPFEIDYDRWNTFSRILVSTIIKRDPMYWGPSHIAPKDILPQRFMVIDGEAATTMRQYKSIKDIEHLKYDITNLAYYLRPSGDACIIGAGGGKDIQSAIVFGHKDIVGIDVNPIFINLLKHQYRKFAGIADREGVTLVIDEARTFLSQDTKKYSLIQMSLIDTWASTAAGAFTLTENVLYTVEGWQIFLSRLKEQGIFTVSRWYNPYDLGETGRLVSLATESLFRFGIHDPSRHLAMATIHNISTLIVSRDPLSMEDIKNLKQVCKKLQYNLVFLPGMTPENAILQKIISSKSPRELRLAIADEFLNLNPPTDEDPYFFNLINLKHIISFIKRESEIGGVVKGNMSAMTTLMLLIAGLCVFTVITILIPLIRKTIEYKKSNQIITINWWGAAYFCLIGTGFMLLEIALIQKLSVFLGHPVYALGVILFTLILSTGIGSYISEYIPLMKGKWFIAFPFLVGMAILASRIVLPLFMSEMIASPRLLKIFLSIAVIFPIGLLLGFFFPMGMRLVKSGSEIQQPWFWALNGIFSVLASPLAVFISINFGVSINFYIAASCYVVLALIISRLYALSRNETLTAGY